jgi:glycosyltransferase involved in cell wall biosynthesis
VIPWYGLETVGGAEIHARRLAESLRQAGVEIEILTTCGKDYFSPQAGNYYPAGLGEVNGIPVRRFRLREDRGESFFAAHPEVLEGVERPSLEHYHPANELQAEDALFDFLLAHREEYYYAFMPYVWGLTVWGARLCPDRAFLIPCLHDEPWAYSPAYRPAFASARGLLFNADPEMELAHRLYGFDRQRAAVIGEGIDMDWVGDARRFRVKYGLYDPFVLFVGRRDEGKRALMLISYFCEYKSQRPGNLKLALAGKNPIPVPPAFADQVVDLGFLCDQDKHDAYTAATIFCLPSVIESFSIVLMEAWLQGTPALVNAACAVTRDHCQKSKGGLFFRDYFEFAGCLDYLLGRPDVRTRMGQAGGEYVRQNYDWHDVVRRFVAQVYGPAALPTLRWEPASSAAVADPRIER